MHADGDWQAVEGVLTKEIATAGEYLQTWNLKLTTIKTVSAAFHLNNKEPKRELKVKYNNENLPFCQSWGNQKIFPGEAKNFLGGRKHPCAPLLVTGLRTPSTPRV